MNRFVTRPSVSAMRSSSTTSPRLPSLSNDVGNPSSRRMLGMSRFSYAACHSPQYHVMHSGGGSIMASGVARGPRGPWPPKLLVNVFWSNELIVVTLLRYVHKWRVIYRWPGNVKKCLRIEGI